MHSSHVPKSSIFNKYRIAYDEKSVSSSLHSSIIIPVSARVIVEVGEQRGDAKNFVVKLVVFSINRLAPTVRAINEKGAL